MIARSRQKLAAFLKGLNMDFFEVEDVCKILGIHRRTADRYWKTGKLWGYKVKNGRRLFEAESVREVWREFNPGKQFPSDVVSVSNTGSTDGKFTITFKTLKGREIE